MLDSITAIGSKVNSEMIKKTRTGIAAPSPTKMDQKAPGSWVKNWNPR
ncbi:MAG: hypothetical protein LBF56_03185 [Holosporales bacterium]|nr:hypothetical protein [Holosporales bacterium]